MVGVWSVPVFHLIMQLSEFRGLVLVRALLRHIIKQTVVDSAIPGRPGPAMESTARAHPVHALAPSKWTCVRAKCTSTASA